MYSIALGELQRFPSKRSFVTGMFSSDTRLLVWSLGDSSGDASWSGAFSLGGVASLGRAGDTSVDERVVSVGLRCNDELEAVKDDSFDASRDAMGAPVTGDFVLRTVDGLRLVDILGSCGAGAVCG